jgi:uncharacterized membrane protein
LPEPLHPAVVHFPIVLALLFPIFALGAIRAIRCGARPHRAWLMPLAFAVAVAGSAWVAVRTGEAEEDRVERIVGETVLHQHEESAERFLVLAGVLALVTAVGLAGGTLGSAGRLLSTLGAVGLAFAAVQVGARGGELVYRHGAASAYVGVDAALRGQPVADPGDIGHPGEEWARNRGPDRDGGGDRGPAEDGHHEEDR